MGRISSPIYNQPTRGPFFIAQVAFLFVPDLCIFKHRVWSPTRNLAIFEKKLGVNTTELRFWPIIVRHSFLKYLWKLTFKPVFLWSIVLCVPDPLTKPPATTPLILRKLQHTPGRTYPRPPGPKLYVLELLSYILVFCSDWGMFQDSVGVFLRWFVTQNTS